MRDPFSLLDSKDQNQLNVSHSHNRGRSLVVIVALFEALGLGFESPGMHHFFNEKRMPWVRWHLRGSVVGPWRSRGGEWRLGEVAPAWQ
jgi:hypothetical protein